MSNQKTTANVPSTSQEVQQAAAGIAKTTIADNAAFEYVTVGGVRFVREDRWVSVTERLPVVETSVIVTYDGLVSLGYYMNGWNVGEYETRENVTHWMPLPEPPKEETP